MDKQVFLRRWLALATGAVLLLTIGVLVSTGIQSVVSDDVSPPLASANGNDGHRIVSMVTVRSAVDPFPGHKDHQLVVLQLDTSGRVFTGTLSYTSTKPVEVVVLYVVINHVSNMTHTENELGVRHSDFIDSTKRTAYTFRSGISGGNRTDRMPPISSCGGAVPRPAVA